MEATRRPCLALFVLALTGASPEIGHARADAQGSPDVVAVVNGRTRITLNEVDSLAGRERPSRPDRMNSARRRGLEVLITRALLEDEARARGLTVEQLREKLVPRRVKVKQSQVDSAYAARAPRYVSSSEAEAKQAIRRQLECKAKARAYQVALAEMRRRARVEIALPEATGSRVDVSEAGPWRGAAVAPLTIVAFSDFQCPYCKEASQTLARLLNSSGRRVKLVYKHLPLDPHPWAFQAARAAVCAGEQGRFWEYHDRLFERSIDLSGAALDQYAADVGLKASEFTTCLESETSRAAVNRDIQEARQAGISGTPTFVVDGKVLRGARSLDEFMTALDQGPERATAAPWRSVQLRRTNP